MHGPVFFITETLLCIPRPGVESTPITYYILIVQLSRVLCSFSRCTSVSCHDATSLQVSFKSLL